MAVAASRGTFSQLLADLAAAPRGDQRTAWDRGFRRGDVIVDRFELLEPLGRGGFGVVWRARDRKLNRLVAFKAIPPGGHDDEHVQREAEVAAQLEHPNLVRLYDYGRCESGAFLIFELVSGETIAHRLQRGALPVREAVRIASEVTQALVHAHAHGVLHRDLKPANVLITEAGRAKVLDFGLAYYFGEGPARSGTPGYMAPEQVRGGAEDGRTDVFAAGVLLREMVTGQRPAAASPGARRAGGPGRDDLPPAVATLVARATDPDPAGRPADAMHLAAELEAVERGLAAARRRRNRVALLTSGAVAGAIAAWAYRPGVDRAGVAVADFENRTGDPELDSFSGLLRTSLEQWPRLSVLPRQRVLALAPLPDAQGKVGCDEARSAARRTECRAVVCGGIERGGSGYSVQLDVLDPASGRSLFDPVSEGAPSREEVQALVDRISARLNEGLTPPARSRQPLERAADTITPSLEAYGHYYAGVQCADHPAHGQDCSRELRRALEIDPGFALAAYELAVWATWNGRPRAEQRSLIELAQRLSGRAPRKERTLIRAWKAHLDGDDGQALDLLSAVAKGWPEDRQAFYQAGDILRHRDEPVPAARWFEGALALDPDFPWAAGGLAQTLGASGRTEDLRRWASRWEAGAGPGSLHGLSLARGWLGETDKAAGAARRAVALGAGIWAQEDLLQAELFAGDYDAVREGARALASRASAVRRMGYYGLAGLEAYQGRPRSGLAALDELARELPDVRQDAVYHAIRADYLVGAGDAGAVWVEVEAARALDSRLAAEHAVSLAYLGDLEHAAGLARDLPRGSALEGTYEALARLQRGDLEGALQDLRRISAATPIVTWRIAPLFLYGERLAIAGRDAEAVEALGRAQALYVPLAMWRSWAYPRSLYLLARSYERLGRVAEARATVERLLGDWSRPEAGIPLLEDARALRARLPAR